MASSDEIRGCLICTFIAVDIMLNTEEKVLISAPPKKNSNNPEEPINKSAYPIATNPRIMNSKNITNLATRLKNCWPWIRSSIRYPILKIILTIARVGTIVTAIYRIIPSTLSNVSSILVAFLLVVHTVEIVTPHHSVKVDWQNNIVTNNVALECPKLTLTPLFVKFALPLILLITGLLTITRQGWKF